MPSDLFISIYDHDRLHRRLHTDGKMITGAVIMLVGIIVGYALALNNQNAL